MTQGSTLEFIVNATDPQGDYLVFTASNLPTGASFDSQTRTFYWIPEMVETVSNVMFYVNDGHSSVSQSIVITVLPSIPTDLQGSLANRTLNLNLIYYGNATPTVDSQILKAKPKYLIINSPHGLWTQISSDNAFQNIAEYQAAGIKVIGYITGGYEGTHSDGSINPMWYTLEMNEELIKSMAEMDHVDGVFIDECTDFPSDTSKTYLKTLTDLAHSYGLITWGNVGDADFDPWYFIEGGFDLMQSSEDWHGQTLSQIQHDWGYRISVSGLGTTNTAQDAYKLTEEAWQQGIGYCYISTTYKELPSWFEDYIALLRK